MTIYRYAGNSVIKDAVFNHTKNRPPVALLTAAQDALPDQLASLRLALKAEGWQSLPAYAEGNPVLQVSGFQQNAQLDTLLREHHFIEGQAAISGQPADEAKLSQWERIRHMSLKLAGMFNLVGNTTMMFDGHKKSDPYRIAGGGLLTLGAANLVHFGNAKSEHFEREVAEDLAEFMRKQGINLPQDSRLLEIIQHKSTVPLAGVQNFLYRHPADVTLGVDSVGAAALLASGIKKYNNKEGVGGLGFGIGSLGLKLLSLVLPEKSPEEIKKSAADKTRNPIHKAIDWLREKPLRLYGTGSLVSDVFLGMDAYQQFKTNPGKKGYVTTAVAATSYTMADVMISLSSKDHVNDDGKFTPDEQRSIEAMAAETLAQQPEVARGPMAQKLGKFLETRKEMQGNATTISQSIIEQASHMKDHPWVTRAASDELSVPAR